MTQEFLRYDTGKFSTHASVPALLREIAMDAHSLDKQYHIHTLHYLIELFGEFKLAPSKLKLARIILDYCGYVSSIDKNVLQKFETYYESNKDLYIGELFAILYENHTRVSTKGAEKYPLGNWLNSQPRDILRCLEPCERHMIYYPLVKKEIVDIETGLPHYMATIWNLVAMYRLFIINEEVCIKTILGVKD